MTSLARNLNLSDSAQSRISALFEQSNASEGLSGEGLRTAMRDTSGLVYDSGNGTLASVSYSSNAGNLVHFTSSSLKINSTCTTNYATSSSTIFSSQNGYTAGLLSSISVDSDGVLSGTYSNGVTIELYALALATFTNLQGLNSVGDNLYTSTLDSGDATTNRANTGIAGSVSGNTLESSNVDMEIGRAHV